MFDPKPDTEPAASQDRVRATPVILSGSIIAAMGKVVYDVEKVGGTPNMATLPFGDWIVSSPAMSGTKLYIGAQDGKLHVLNRGLTSFTELSTFQAGSAIDSSPAVAYGTVFFGTSLEVCDASTDKWVYALDADPSDGIDEGFDDPAGVSYDVLWKYQTGGCTGTSPFVADDKVGLISSQGILYVFDATIDATVDDPVLFYQILWTHTGLSAAPWEGSASIADGVVVAPLVAMAA